MVQSFRKNVTSALVVLVLAVSACGPATSESPAGGMGSGPRVEYVDETGALHFASAKAFMEAIDTLSGMPSRERLAWEERIGFKSQRSAFEELSKQYEQAGTQEEQARLLREYSDVADLSNGAPRPRISSPGYASLINRQGLFFVDGVIHKVTPRWVISSEDGQRETVNAQLAALEVGGKTLREPMLTPAEGVRAVNHAGDTAVRAQGDCGYGQSTTATNSDRRLHFDMGSTRYYVADATSYYNSVGIKWTLRGEKKNFWGNWVAYDTTLESRNVSFTLPVPHVPLDPYANVEYVITTVSGLSNASNGDVGSLSGEAMLGDWVKDTYVPRPVLIQVAGEATSRGLGGMWATINCY